MGFTAPVARGDSRVCCERPRSEGPQPPGHFGFTQSLRALSHVRGASPQFPLGRYRRPP